MLIIDPYAYNFLTKFNMSHVIKTYSKNHSDICMLVPLTLNMLIL